jgi:hypothetical protein
MNKKLKEFAAQAGFNLSGDYHCDENELTRFAELVRQDEREACAKTCEDGLPIGLGQTIGPMMCANAIRKRGEK